MTFIFVIERNDFLELVCKVHKSKCVKYITIINHFIKLNYIKCTTFRKEF